MCGLITTYRCVDKFIINDLIDMFVTDIDDTVEIPRKKHHENRFCIHVLVFLN